MQQSEIIALIIFALFWWFIYSQELKFLISFFRRKGFARNSFAFFIHALAALGVVCFLYAYFIEPYQLEVKYVNLKSAKIKDNWTLVQISDLHCDTKIRNEEKIVEIINAINPDIIVFTGDALNTEKSLGIFQKTLKSLKAKSGKFAVRGNFDIWYWKDIDLFKDTGFIELDGKMAGLGSLVIAGLNVESGIEKLAFLEKLAKDHYTVFLFHYPGLNETLKSPAIDLYLSGHTHGGQFSLPLYGALVTMSQYGKKYESGLYNLGQNKFLYVNRGIGMEGGIAPRIRFFSSPEITVFRINAEKH